MTKTHQEDLKGISIVEVSGESCANCYSLLPLLVDYVKSREDVVLHHIEANMDSKNLLKNWEITAVPMILICYQNQVEARVKGYQPKEILSLWLDAKIDDVKKKYSIL